MPVGISPTAFHQWLTADGELATARAAHRAGVVYIASIRSNYRMEEIAAAAPNATKWQQTQTGHLQSTFYVARRMLASRQLSSLATNL